MHTRTGDSSSVGSGVSVGSVVTVGLWMSPACVDHTVVPLGCGYFGLGLAALLVVLWTERGRLFVPHHPDPAPAKASAEAAFH